eukprot:SAG22_NODE_18785_length_281_cov_1.126374_1_plen_82_part_10
MQYDFSWIIGGGQSLIFRRGLWADLELEVADVDVEKQRYRDVRADATARWGEPVLQLRPAPAATYEVPVDEFGPAAAATDAG